METKKIDVFLDETLPAVQMMPPSQARELLDAESTEVIAPWSDRNVTWKGSGIPVSLREWESKLYLITFDRTSQFRLRYYAQNGVGFSEIKPNDFPKRIATQNLWLKADSYGTGVDGRKIYAVEQAVKIDPEDPYFSHELTAVIWCQLMTGKEYGEVKKMADPHPILREYVKKYSPIKLTAVVRTKGQDKNK